MENVIEILEAINDFSDFVKARALELVRARGYKRSVSLYKLVFNTKGVDIIYREDTNHDCPDYKYVDLSISQLEQNDFEWELYVKSVELETLEKKDNERLLAEKRLLETKEKQFLILKKELGH